MGFELLDQEKFGVSQFTEQVNYQRAPEGELARTIENLGPIQSARVHLATPKPSMFVREQKNRPHPSPLTCCRAVPLTTAVVAITHLISSAVTGLAAESVTIVDQRGNLLTQSGQRGLQTAHLKYTSEIETDYQQRIQRILALLVGMKTSALRSPRRLISPSRNKLRSSISRTAILKNGHPQPSGQPL